MVDSSFPSKRWQNLLQMQTLKLVIKEKPSFPKGHAANDSVNVVTSAGTDVADSGDLRSESAPATGIND